LTDTSNSSVSHVSCNLEYTSPDMSEKNTTDRRAGQRTPVRVPVKLRHQGSEHAGLTRDLSATGIFLYSETGLKPGSKLELVIMLPPGMGLGPGGWTLCEASVVRVEESEGKSVGIAASLDRIALLPEIS
jgi:PilZ domain